MTPDSYTLEETTIPVSDGHNLYAQSWGNKDAQTTYIFLHGGPGSGCSDGHKKYFDPETQRVIFFDQRGCGRSTPYGSLEANTTANLMQDISVIADYFAVSDFVFVGGSWGSCLALAYALENPDRVSAMILRGIFTGSQSEIDFLDQGQFQAFFPDVWEKFANRTPEEYRDNPAAYHQPRVLGTDQDAIAESSLAYAELEGSLVSLDDRFTAPNPEDFDPASTRIEVSYMANRCFMEDNFIFNNAHKLSMPVWLVQGRYDAICAPVNAHKLHSLLPNSKLIWTIAGHSGSDRCNFDVTKALVEALA